jgi:hypothetical protein
MKKRGPIVGLSGVIITMASFLAMLSMVPNTQSTVNGEFLLSNFLDGIFSEVSNEVQIFPGESNTFSYASSVSEIQLLWGLQVTDYQEGDSFTVTASNIYGDDYGTFRLDGPVLFDMFAVSSTDFINFQVQNTGDRPINVVMMFAEDPDNSKVFSNPNSPLMSTLIPLAISGIVMILGIIVIIAGAILTIVDWKKTKNQSRNF